MNLAMKTKFISRTRIAGTGIAAAVALTLGTQHASALTPTYKATFELNTGLYQTDTLTIGPTVALDMTNNWLIVHNGNLATLTSYGATGINLADSGWWDGVGIQSATAAATNGLFTKGVGIIQNEYQGSPIYASWHGQAVLQTDILIAYTWEGDADLDGLITGLDTFLLGDNVDNGNVYLGWLNGDFDYGNDGVTGLDTFLQGNAVDNGGDVNQPLAGGLASGGAAAVPEPTSLGLLALGAFGLLRHRFRRNIVGSL